MERPIEDVIDELDEQLDRLPDLRRRLKWPVSNNYLEMKAQEPDED